MIIFHFSLTLDPLILQLEMSVFRVMLFNELVNGTNDQKAWLFSSIKKKGFYICYSIFIDRISNSLGLGAILTLCVISSSPAVLNQDMIFQLELS